MNFKLKLVHPGKLTWNIITEVWKIIFLSKWVIYMFHVNLPGCTNSGLKMLLYFQSLNLFSGHIWVDFTTKPPFGGIPWMRSICSTFTKSTFLRMASHLS